jgi:hypothetical protein
VARSFLGVISLLMLLAMAPAVMAVLQPIHGSFRPTL